MDLTGLKTFWNNLITHLRGVIKKDGVALKSWWDVTGPKVEQVAITLGEEVLGIGASAVLAKATGGASLGVSLDAGFEAIKAVAPAEFKAADKQALTIVLSKALPAAADAAQASANAQAPNTTGALNS